MPITSRSFWFVVLASAAITPCHPDAVVPFGSSWHYRKGTSEASAPLEAWRGGHFSIADWPTGAAPFHYGEPGVTGGTVLADMRNGYTSVFLRRSFDLPNLSTLGSLTLTARCDDGFVAWINGVEVARYRMNPGDVTFGSVANSSAPEPITPVSYTITNLAGLGTSGNVLAVQAFNQSRTSSDLQFDARLESAIRDHTAPRISGVTPAAGQVGALAQIEITFSEAVQGVDEDDLLINGAPCHRVSGGGSLFAFAFRQPAYGVVTVRWASHHGITDLGVPPNALDLTSEFASWQYALIDNTAPAVASRHPAAGATVRALAQIEVEFSEAVAGLDATDLLINGQPATTVSGFGRGPFVFHFPAAANGPVSIAWANGHGITDLAAPPNSFAEPAGTIAVDSTLPVPPIILAEFCASNVTGLQDEDGDTEDWIELFNSGTTTANLAGWSLTDDADVTGKWILPAVTLAADQRLLVFASGKDRRDLTPGARLHTNFKLAGDGEYLALFSGDSPRLPVTEFKPQFPDQRNDHSYGAVGSEWRYFATPTPEAPNGASGITGVVNRVRFAVGRGFFDQPFALTLTNEAPAAEIRFTTDGSVPTPTNGATYGTPIPITTTTTVRAAAFRAGSLPSRVTTHTYLFPAAILRQPARPPGFPQTWGSSKLTTGDYAMDARVVDDPAYATLIRVGLTNIPAVCLTLPVDDWFSPARGIYSNGDREGMAWERAGSMEYLAPDGDDFQENCGIRIQGGTSTQPWKSYKLSLRTTFRGDYGPARLERGLFPAAAVERFDTLILDAGLNYVWSYGGGVSPEDQRRRARYIGDQFVSDLQNLAAPPAVHGRFVHVFLNGLYWGLHNLHEEPDAAYGADWFGGNKDDYDVIKHTGNNAIDGTTAAWNAMMQMARSGLASSAKYTALGEVLDLAALADYLIIQFYVGNTDWPHHNWYALRRRAPGAKWRFVSWDSEHILKTPTENRTGVSDINTPAELYSLLRANPEFRLLFADRAHRLFFNGGPLYVNPARPAWDPASPQDNRPAALYDQRVAEIDLALIAESARWGDNQRPAQPYTRNADYLTELNWLRTQYFPQRSAIVLNQLRGLELYPPVAAPAFNHQAGWVPRGFALTQTAPAGTIYYTLNGSDPRMANSGAVNPGAFTWSPGQTLALNATLLVRARARVNGVWSALNEARFEVAETDTPLRLTELMYDSGAGDALDFIELMNTSTADLDVSGWSLEGVRFVFLPGSVVKAGQIIVLSADADPLAFAQAHPGVEIFGWYGGNLANAGETLALKDPTGRSLWSIRYEPSPPWPAANANGHSLEVVDPANDPGDPANWRPSVSLGGSPGRWAGSALPTVRLNEIFAAPAARPLTLPLEADWIELHNPTDVLIPLANWSLSDGHDPRRFVFPPDALLPPGGFLTVTATSAANPPGLVSGFGLDREAGTVTLYDPATNVVDAVTYGAQLNGTSIGRDTTGAWSLNTPTPGTTNQLLPMARVDQLVINEWLANPPPGDDDWVEVHNRHAALAVDVFGAEIVTAKARARFGYHAFVPPGGFLRLWATGSSAPDSLGVRLPAAGGVIELRDELGALVDRVHYPAQVEGPSSGRWPDGVGTVKQLGARTPGWPNSDHPADSDWDGDGLPDAWETLHQLDARRAGGINGGRGDPDGDLFTNAEEFVAGTDPRSPGSRLALTLAVVEEGQISVKIPTIAGRIYYLEAANGATDAAWEVIHETGPVAVSGDLDVALSPVEGERRFFRVRLK